MPVDPYDTDLARQLRAAADGATISPEVLRRAACRLEVLSAQHDKARGYLVDRSLAEARARADRMRSMVEEFAREFSKLYEEKEED